MATFNKFNDFSEQLARGVQNKVLEAMAMEKVVIATPQALEGISAVPGSEVLDADSADGFIRHISRQLASLDDIGAAARRRILRDYDWGRNLQRLGRALGVAAKPADAPQPRQAADAERGP